MEEEPFKYLIKLHNSLVKINKKNDKLLDYEEIY